MSFHPICRSYHEKSIASHQHSEIKPHWAPIVLRLVITWEVGVMTGIFLFTFCRFDSRKKNVSRSERRLFFPGPRMKLSFCTSNERRSCWWCVCVSLDSNAILFIYLLFMVSVCVFLLRVSFLLSSRSCAIERGKNSSHSHVSFLNQWWLF